MRATKFCLNYLRDELYTLLVQLNIQEYLEIFRQNSTAIIFQVKKW